MSRVTFQNLCHQHVTALEEALLEASHQGEEAAKLRIEARQQADQVVDDLEQQLQEVRQGSLSLAQDVVEARAALLQAVVAAALIKKGVQKRDAEAAAILALRMDVIRRYDLITPPGLDKFEQDIILKRIPAHMNASLAAVLRKTRGVCGAQTPRTVLISGAPIRKRHSLYSSFFMYTFVV